MNEKWVVIDGWYRIVGVFDTHEEAKELHKKKMEETDELWWVETLKNYNDSVYHFATAYYER